VRAERVERMAQVLRALREGDAQELLFQPTLPIEDALNEVFRRYAGGRSGGHRILDYREYVELSVEILRQTGDTWELANPTRLSTGEAIGGRAALMMVVLSEWERDANLLRGKREHGSLRFLFLDEANRLSPDNLGVLFDLCQSLELQLLMPPRGRARRRQHTYRLVRTVTDDGREEVIVSGRRAAMPASPASIGREPVTARGRARRVPLRMTRARYLPALDGLRALSVLGSDRLSRRASRLGGGFLGVEVFFVVSGYLITSLLLLEQCGSGRISLPQFWLSARAAAAAGRMRVVARYPDRVADTGARRSGANAQRRSSSPDLCSNWWASARAPLVLSWKRSGARSCCTLVLGRRRAILT